MNEGGRRIRWGVEIKRLFGAELFNHVGYYDVVGSSLSKDLQTFVITDINLYIYPTNAKNKPEPFCALIEIEDIKSDHETPESFRKHCEYEAQHVYFKVRGQIIDIYTFEAGSDLFWRLTNAVANSRRSNSIKYYEATVESGQIELITIDGQKVPILNYYLNRFNQISSHVIHSLSHTERMKSLKELNDVSYQYFPIRIIFFQSSSLISYLVKMLDIFSDFHTVRPELTSNRVEQVELIQMILQVFRSYLADANTIKDATRLLQFNHGEHITILVKSLLCVEWFILSQPTRAPFFLKAIPSELHNKYFQLLQDIEEHSVSLLSQLYIISVCYVRNDPSHSNFFLSLIQKYQSLCVGGCFHAIVFMTTQMCYAMDEMAKVPMLMGYSLYDHLWAIDFLASNLPAATKMLKNEFSTEFDIVITEERFQHHFSSNFVLMPEIHKVLNNIRSIIGKRTNEFNLYENQSVQFR